MKKNLLIFLLTILFFLFTSINIARADDINGIAYFFSNNRNNIIWQVGYRLVGDSELPPNLRQYRPTYSTMVDDTSCGAGNRCKLRPIQGSIQPTYGLQWGTGCIDPISEVKSFFGLFESVSVDVTMSRANLDSLSGIDPASYNYLDDIQYFENNGGVTVYFSAFRQMNCPSQPAFTIDGYVYLDNNGDGNRDSGEPGWPSPGQPVEKWGDTYENTGTSSTGYFRFFNLPPRSDYRVRMSPPSGFSCTSANNCDVSGLSLPPSRTLYFGLRCNRGDLVVGTNFTYPGGPDDSTSDVSITIRNAGNYAVTNGFTVRVTNGNGAGRSVNVNQNLAPGESLNLSGSFTGMPNPPAGAYTAVATVDVNNSVAECNESNNVQTDSYGTNTPRPDLIVSHFRYPGGDPADSSDPEVEIKNIGNKSVTAAYTVRVFNGAAATNDVSFTNNLAPGQVLDVSDNFANMPLPAVGCYTARAVVDVTDNIGESDEGNNVNTDGYCTSVVPLPDLVIPNFQFPGGPAGSTVDPYITIRNRGTRPVTRNFSMTIDNGAGYTSTQRITDFNAANPMPAKSIRYDVSRYFTGIPLPPTGGTYTASISIDVFNLVAELNETNNSRWREYIVPVIPVTPTYSVSGTVYIENLPFNGFFDPGEAGYPGIVYVSNGMIMPSGGTVAGLIEGSYQFVFYDIPAGYESSTPKQAVPPTSSVIVSVGPGCNADAVRPGAYCVDGNVYNLNFGLQQIPPDPWIQGVGGDIRTDNGFTNKVPAGSYFTTTVGGLQSGVVFGSNPYDLGASGNQSTKTSTQRWFVSGVKFAPDIIKTSYEYVSANMKKNDIWDSAVNLFGGATPCSGYTCPFGGGLGAGNYIANQNVLITGNTTFGGGDYVFIIQGNLIIDGNIIVPSGSTAIFIVTGDINVSSGVDRIDGIFSADKNFVVQGVGGALNDRVLQIQGNVIANAYMGQRQNPPQTVGVFRNDRNRAYVDLNAAPVVSIIYRPDFILNAPDLIRYSNIKVQEVAPGDNSLQ